MLRSADHGATWHAWNYGLLDLAINAIAYSPKFDEDETCFTASDYAVFMSVNGGRPWQALPLPIEVSPFAALDITPDGQLYVATEGHGLWIAICRTESCGRSPTSPPLRSTSSRPAGQRRRKGCSRRAEGHGTRCYNGGLWHAQNNKP